MSVFRVVVQSDELVSDIDVEGQPVELEKPRADQQQDWEGIFFRKAQSTSP